MQAGQGQTWKKGSTAGASFTIKRSRDDASSFQRFQKAQVDGKTLQQSRDYTASKGSVIIDLTKAYLDTFATGKHTLTALFTDGRVDAPFTVAAKEEPAPLVTPAPRSFEEIAVPRAGFTFTKVWIGGEEKKFDYTLYKVDGSVYSHDFAKEEKGQGKWKYEAWFSKPVACFLVEKPVPGYSVRYENVGIYTNITDRCCDGGTIVNYKVPQTGDNAHLMGWALMALVSATILSVTVVKRKKHAK